MRLRESRLPPIERDRRAILAMAGPYRVSFDFLEVVRFDPALKPDAPYQSWGTEYVFVAEDRPDFIALQHILAMRVLQPDGKVSEPMVVRHWRQEWRYQAERLLAYEGANTWAPRAVPAADRARRVGAERATRSTTRRATPRAGAGSTATACRPGSATRPGGRCRAASSACARTTTCWSAPTATPSRRPAGCRRRTTSSSSRADERYLAREYGVARYERIKDYDFSAGARRYFDAHRAVLGRGARRLARDRGAQALHACARQPDQGQLFVPFFEYAAKLDEGARFRSRRCARLRQAHAAGALPGAVGPLRS